MTEMRFAKNADMRKGFKTKRRRMLSFKMDEISGVDKPAQEGALILITKRAPDDVETFVKASFNAVMAERERESEICRAFYEAFEDQWTANDALREALKDAYSDGEQSVREYVAKIEEMAFAALNSIQKNSTSDIVGKAHYFSAVAEASASFTKQAEATMYTTIATLKAAIAKFAKDGGDAAEIKTIRKSAIELDAVAELTGDLAIAPATPVEDPAVATLKREVAVLKLADDARSYFDALDAAGQDAFLGKSAEAQRADIDMAKSADPVVYTCDDGTAIRKSDGAALLAMAKRGDKLAKELADAKADNADKSFEKTAREEFKYLPTDGTVEMLKAADALPEDKKKKMLDAMRASNTAAKKNFTPLGKGAEPDVDGESGDDPVDKLDGLAKAHQAANPGTSFAKAYDVVLATPEGAALYAKSVGDVPDGDEG